MIMFTFGCFTNFSKENNNTLKTGLLLSGLSYTLKTKEQQKI
ncbi:unnamed protein product [Arabidopsis halleri]